MKFDPPLIEARLIQRYKRFLADVEMADGTLHTVHCPNPGAMVGLTTPGSRVWISDSRNPKRKLRHTLEIMEADDTLVGINTNLPNRLAKEALEEGLIGALNEFETLRTEVRYGENSRIDILLQGQSIPDTYVEIKNVHLRRNAGLHEFPDCVTARGAKHLRELSQEAKSGNRAVMLFVIQREDGDRFSLARDYDEAYGTAFDDAIRYGVEAYAIRCRVTPEEIVACDMVPVLDVRG